MQQRDAIQRTTSAKADHTYSGKCTQCGDALDSERLKRLASGEHVLCRDCAFDAMPCTD